MKIKTKITSAIILTTFIISIISVVPVNALPTGKFGNALVFDGDDDFVEVTNSGCLNIGGSAITLEAWVKVEEFPVSSRVVIIGKYNAYALQILPGGGVRVYLGAISPYTDTASGVLSLNTWHHIAGTYDGEHVRIYVDGYLEAEADETGDQANTGNNVFIGNNQAKTGPFKGTVDEVRISNNVRYTAEFIPDDKPFVEDGNTAALWHFDEGGGNTVSDSADTPCDDEGLIYGASWLIGFFTLTFQGDTPPVQLSILEEGDLPACIPPLPAGLILTPYVNVEITGEFQGMVEVAFHYEDTGDDDLEEGFRLYMADCVDFNLDGTINGIDISIIKKAIRTGELNDPRYDVNNDGEVNQLDVDIVKIYATQGLIVNLDLYGLEQARLPWIDITTEVDTELNIVYGVTSWFSLFRCR